MQPGRSSGAIEEARPWSEGIHTEDGTNQAVDARCPYESSEVCVSAVSVENIDMSFLDTSDCDGKLSFSYLEWVLPISVTCIWSRMTFLSTRLLQGRMWTCSEQSSFSAADQCNALGVNHQLATSHSLTSGLLQGRSIGHCVLHNRVWSCFTALTLGYDGLRLFLTPCGTPAGFVNLPICVSVMSTYCLLGDTSHSLV